MEYERELGEPCYRALAQRCFPGLVGFRTPERGAYRVGHTHAATVSPDLLVEYAGVGARCCTGWAARPNRMRKERTARSDSQGTRAAKEQMMTDEQRFEEVTEEVIAEVTAKLVRWSATLTEREQAALAGILEQAAGTDDTRGQIIIVGGSELARREVVRRGVLAGISSLGLPDLPDIGAALNSLYGGKDGIY